VRQGEARVAVDPRIETVQLRLVGVQGIIRMDRDVKDDLGTLYRRLFGKLRQIPDISRPHRTIGYWQFIESDVRLHFAGVEVDSFRHFKWDYEGGLVAWTSGTTTFAIWKERNGQEGKLKESGMCWDWLARSRYLYNPRFLGDFEVYYWKTLAREPQSDYHEVWIPVTEKAFSS
jgi:predicted transcriptional regulator YdeE